MTTSPKTALEVVQQKYENAKQTATKYNLEKKGLNEELKKVNASLKEKISECDAKIKKQQKLIRVMGAQAKKLAKEEASGKTRHAYNKNAADGMDALMGLTAENVAKRNADRPWTKRLFGNK